LSHLVIDEALKIYEDHENEDEIERINKLIEEIYPDHGHYEFLYGSTDHLEGGDWGIFPVNSAHHQAVDYNSISDKITVTCWSFDGQVEAYTYGNFAIGVQWHPEWMDDAGYSWQLIEAVLTRKADKIKSFNPFTGIEYLM